MNSYLARHGLTPCQDCRRPVLDAARCGPCERRKIDRDREAARELKARIHGQVSP